MTSPPRDEDALEGVDRQAREHRSAQDARDRDTNRMIKVQLVGALWCICLLAPTLLFSGWLDEVGVDRHSRPRHLCGGHSRLQARTT
jgi:hypothetical protein